MIFEVQNVRTRLFELSVVVAFTAILTIFLVLDYRQIQSQAGIDLGNVSKTMEARLDEGLIGPVERDLTVLASSLALQQISGGRLVLDRKKLDLWVRRYQDLDSVVVTDSQGDTLYSPSHDGAVSGLIKENAFISASNQRRSLMAVAGANRLYVAVLVVGDGAETPMGWVVGSIDLSAVQTLLDSVALGFHGVMTLRFVENLQIIVRTPRVPAIDKPFHEDYVDLKLAQGVNAGALSM